jgi:hypothetical protein
MIRRELNMSDNRKRVGTVTISKWRGTYENTELQLEVDLPDGTYPIYATIMETCGVCGGSGWVVRDPDIGTDQECFGCHGERVVEVEPEPAEREVVRLKALLERVLPKLDRTSMLHDEVQRALKTA